MPQITEGKDNHNGDRSGSADRKEEGHPTGPSSLSSSSEDAPLVGEEAKNISLDEKMLSSEDIQSAKVRWKPWHFQRLTNHLLDTKRPLSLCLLQNASQMKFSSFDPSLIQEDTLVNSMSTRSLQSLTADTVSVYSLVNTGNLDMVARFVPTTLVAHYNDKETSVNLSMRDGKSRQSQGER